MSVQPIHQADRVPNSDFVTPEVYLERERRAETKSEYRDGEIVAIAGATEAHILINTNVTIALGSKLRGGSRRLFANDLKVGVHETNRYYYPDLVVVCGERIFRDENKDVLTNPTLIVEVLSRWTEPNDRGGKFRQYQRIPSLREYVLVAQDQAAVERYVRQGESNLWLYSVTAGTESTVTLESIGDVAAGGVSLRLSEIYDGVEFPPAAFSTPPAE